MPKGKKDHSTQAVNVHLSTGWVPEDWKRFVELPYFTAKWKALRLNDDDLRALQIILTALPEKSPVVKGTGGLRKCRFARANSNAGKSGGYRIGYVYFEEFGVIGLIAVYSKKDQDDIPAAQRPLIKEAIKRLREWVAKN